MSQSAIDWGAVRERLRKSEEALRLTLADDPTRMKKVFRQRAVQLARKPDTNTSVAAQTSALFFRVAEERHAIALSELTEVLAFRDCTQVPGTAPALLGVINLRGVLRPVLDLGQILAGATSAKSGKILVLRRGAALKVDRVEELRELRPDDITLLNTENLLSAGQGSR